MDLVILRLLFVALLAGVCYFLQPFGLPAGISAGLGAATAAAVIVFVYRVRALTLRCSIGAWRAVIRVVPRRWRCFGLLLPSPSCRHFAAVLQISVAADDLASRLLLARCMGFAELAVQHHLQRRQADAQERQGADALKGDHRRRYRRHHGGGFIDGMMVVPEFSAARTAGMLRTDRRPGGSAGGLRHGAQRSAVHGEHPGISAGQDFPSIS